MRTFHVVFACAMLGGLAGCATESKIDSTLVTSSPLPSMQEYDRQIGYEYWLNTNVLPLCDKPISGVCGNQSLSQGTHVKVDGLVSNHSEIAGH